MWLGQAHVATAARVHVRSGAQDEQHARIAELVIERGATQTTRRFDPLPASCDEAHAAVSLVIALAVEPDLIDDVLGQGPAPKREPVALDLTFQLAGASALLPNWSLGAALGVQAWLAPWLGARAELLAQHARKPRVRAATSTSTSTSTPQSEPALAVAPAITETAPSEAAEEAPNEEARATPASPTMLEMKALAAAKRALSEGEPDRALAILASTTRDFPRGYFIEERRALRVLALAESGESERAKREAAAFARDYPKGPFTERVREATR